MTVKDAVIALCFLGSVLLAILGGWNYMKGRILHYEQKIRIEKMQFAAQPFLSAEDELKKINKEKTNALIMFAGGVTGFFLVISYVNRRRKNKPVHPTHKTNQL
jgi:TRAP-type C4-dicarboxylate transport system permease small subunit